MSLTSKLQSSLTNLPQYLPNLNTRGLFIKEYDRKEIEEIKPYINKFYNDPSTYFEVDFDGNLILLNKTKNRYLTQSQSKKKYGKRLSIKNSFSSQVNNASKINNKIEGPGNGTNSKFKMVGESELNQIYEKFRRLKNKNKKSFYEGLKSNNGPLLISQSNKGKKTESNKELHDQNVSKSASKNILLSVNEKENIKVNIKIYLIHFQPLKNSTKSLAQIPIII